MDLGFNSDSIQITSNLKLDDSYPILSSSELEALKKKLGIGELCIAIGSTHEGEEEALIEQIKPLFVKYPHLKVLLVPRHPERNSAVGALLRQTGLTLVLYSQNETLCNKQILLIDTWGF